jgi:hypothetical protein
MPVAGCNFNCGGDLAMVLNNPRGAQESQKNLPDFVQTQGITCTVIHICRGRGGMCGEALGMLQLTAVLQVVLTPRLLSPAAK